MRKKLRFIFLMASATAITIVLFQLFYVYSNYHSGKKTFGIQLSNILQLSIDQYKARQIEIPQSLQNDLPFLSILMTPADSIKVSNMKSFKKAPSLRFKNVYIDHQSLPEVKKLITRLLARDTLQKIRLDVLTAIYRQELAKNGINLPVTLNLTQRDGQKNGQEVAGIFSLSQSRKVVTATFAGINGYLLSHNLGAVAISVLMILLSAGCLLYMGFIIRRQINLDIIKNEFISNITHELRTPISVLKSTHEALYQFGESGDQEKTARYLQLNTGILNKMEENVDRILKIAEYEQRRPVLDLHPVDLATLVSDVIEQFERADAEMISVENNLGLQFVTTDRYPLETILSNLIDNALKYSDKYKAVKIRINELAGGWQLQVADCGRGIPRQCLPFIFDKFYRVPAGDVHDVKGFGLGLSYVRYLVESLNGTIDVTSKIAVGTTFIIDFPNL